jgi:hypothetical protein
MLLTKERRQWGHQAIDGLDLHYHNSLSWPPLPHHLRGEIPADRVDVLYDLGVAPSSANGPDWLVRQ